MSEPSQRLRHTAAPMNCLIEITAPLHDVMEVISFLWDEHYRYLPPNVADALERLLATCETAARQAVQP